MKFRNLFWGVFFILAAVAILLNQLGFLVGISLFHLIITILLIPIIVKSIQYLNFSGILIPLAIIGILYADQLGIQSLTPWPILGIAVFLSIGLSILIHPKKYSDGGRWKKRCGEFQEESVGNKEEGEVNLSTRFAGSVKYIDSDNLKKVNIDCSYGGMKIYFDHAKIEGEEATINLDVSFSGVELYIPKEWKVIDNVNCILGGIEEKYKNNTTTTENVRLILNGKISFSGVEIIYI